MPQQTSTIAALERASAELDELIRDMRLGRPSQAAHDRHVDRAENVAGSIRSAVRGGPELRRHARPLWISADGRSAMW